MKKFHQSFVGLGTGGVTYPKLEIRKSEQFKSNRPANQAKIPRSLEEEFSRKISLMDLAQEGSRNEDRE